MLCVCLMLYKSLSVPFLDVTATETFTTKNMKANPEVSVSAHGLTLTGLVRANV